MLTIHFFYLGQTQRIRCCKIHSQCNQSAFPSQIKEAFSRDFKDCRDDEEFRQGNGRPLHLGLCVDELLASTTRLLVSLSHNLAALIWRTQISVNIIMQKPKLFTLTWITNRILYLDVGKQPPATSKATKQTSFSLMTSIFIPRYQGKWSKRLLGPVHLSKSQKFYECESMLAWEKIQVYNCATNID